MIMVYLVSKQLRAEHGNHCKICPPKPSDTVNPVAHLTDTLLRARNGPMIWRRIDSADRASEFRWRRSIE
jgi:hypothetical protein